MSGDAEALAAEFERSGFFGWLLTSGDSTLWAERTPEQEMARVILASDWLAAYVAAERDRAVAEARAADAETIATLGDAYRDAIGVPESEHQRRRMEALATALETALAELAALRAALPDEPEGTSA